MRMIQVYGEKSYFLNISCQVYLKSVFLVILVNSFRKIRLSGGKAQPELVLTSPDYLDLDGTNPRCEEVGGNKDHSSFKHIIC